MEAGLFMFGLLVGSLFTLISFAIGDEIAKERKRRDNKLREDIRKDIIEYYETTNEKRIKKDVK